MQLQDVRQSRKRDEYDSISTEVRRALIGLVFEHGVSIRRASMSLGLKYSTGKTLVQQYRRTGKIDRVKQQRVAKQHVSCLNSFKLLIQQNSEPFGPQT